jgi:hypothetical protein
MLASAARTPGWVSMADAGEPLSENAAKSASPKHAPVDKRIEIISFCPPTVQSE